MNEPSPAILPKLSYSLEEAIDATGIPRTALFEDIGAGLLAARKRGRRLVILTSALEAYLAALPAVETKQ